MLKINAMFEKEKFLKDTKETLLMVELEGLKSNKVNKKNKSMPLNLSIAIDISGSMAGYVKGSQYDMFNQVQIMGNGLNLRDIYDMGIVNPQGISNKINKSILKIEQAKIAASKAIDNMQDGDFVSIVLFDNNIQTLVSATKLDSNQRSLIKEKIKTISAKGGTDLHAGWLAAATEVSKNMSSKSINRVLVLTDGQTNYGVTNPKEIESNVKKMAESSITTTCFGIGNDFNEDLLLAITNVGGGNFYYIDDDNKLSDMFKEEFSGFKNMAASSIKVSLKFDDNVNIKEQMNQLNKADDNSYVVADIRHNKKSYLLFKLNINNKPSVINANVSVKYKDENGVEHVEKLKLVTEATSKKKWEYLEFNQEVKVQETLLIIANNKLQATHAISSGNMEKANQLLMDSQAFVNQVDIDDVRLKKEYDDIQNAMLQATEGGDLRKIISTQSYITRYNR